MLVLRLGAAAVVVVIDVVAVAVVAVAVVAVVTRVGDKCVGEDT